MKRLLLIEDDAELREALELFLAHPEVEIVAAQNGIEGLTRAYQYAPQVILLDLTMPDADGFEVHKHLADAQFRPQIFFMTAQTSPEIVARMRACRVAGIIPKPFPEDLRQRVFGALAVMEAEGV